MSTKAQEAQEPQVAIVDDENDQINDPAFDAAFAEESKGTAKSEAPVAPKGDAGDDPEPPKVDPPEPAEPVAETTPPAAASDAPAQPPPPADPPAPLTAMEKAEAEGAKLQAQDAPPAAGAAQTTPDKFPAGYENTPEIVQSDAFKKFFDSASAHVQDTGINGGIKGMCMVVDAFNAYVEKQTAKAAAAANSGTASGTASARRIMAELGDLSMVQADGSKVSVKDYLKEYGDLGEAMAVMADTIAEKRFGNAKPDATHAASNDRIARMEAELSEMRYWRAVAAEHSDAEKIVKTEAFKKFAASASPATKRLMESTNPAHGILALDAFKELQIGEAKKSVTAPTEKLKAMHSDTARGKTVVKRGEALDDFDSAFEAEANKK